MNMKNEPKYIVASVLCIVILFLTVIGVGYISFYYSKYGEQINQVAISTITMSYSEKTNGINLTDAYPMKDDVGKALNDENLYFDFTINTSIKENVIINYIITASKQSDSTLPDDAIKVYLTEINNDVETQILSPTKISSLNKTKENENNIPEDEFILLNSSFNVSESHNYRLRMWIADDYTLSDIGQTYNLRINVYSILDS